MDYINIPTTVFTPLEYGCTGMNEDEAREAYGDNFEAYISDFSVLEWSLKGFSKATGAEESKEGGEEGDETHKPATAYCKVLVNTTPGAGNKVVGLHILGPNCGEITQGFGVAVKKGISFEDLTNTVGIHPTVAEQFTTLSVTKSSGEDAAAGGC